MARVRSRDTKPEQEVRRTLRSLGVGYRLHVRGLPGTPDIVMLGRRKAIFVHGCFWHRHPGCVLATNPKTNAEFWTTKFRGNVARDSARMHSLSASGWDVLVVWQCEIVKGGLEERLRAFLGL
jgi:DNA mismatch endonuclease, patch repair protein